MDQNVHQEVLNPYEINEFFFSLEEAKIVLLQSIDLTSVNHLENVAEKVDYFSMDHKPYHRVPAGHMQMDLNHCDHNPVD